MQQHENAPSELAASTERIANLAEQLGTLLAKMEQQFELLNTKVDRIVAAIDEALNTPCAPATAPDAGSAQTEQSPATDTGLKQRMDELEKQNTELHAAARRAQRKTLSGTTLALLAKSGTDEGVSIDSGSLEKALRSLSVEQRIAVKAEMARAGML